MNFHESGDDKSQIRPIKPNKSIVVIYSCGAEVGQDALPNDHLGSYVKDAFNLIGFSDFYSLRISGVIGPRRDENLQKALTNVASIAENLNKKFVN